jgi:predicted MFS family arabinose efflux permease
MWLMVSIALPALAQGVSSVAFLVMMRESVSQRLIEPLVSKRWLALNLTVAVSGLAMGFWLEKAVFPFNYQIMFLFAFIMTLVSMWNLNRIRVRPELVIKPQSPTQVRPWRSPDFQVVAFIVLLTYISFNVNQPFISLHLTRNLDATEGFISLATLAELMAGALVTLYIHHIIGRVGNRSMIAIMMVGTSLSTFIIATTHNLPITLLASAIGGASWTAVNIGLFAFFTETTPAEHKTAYTIAFNQAVFIATFLGPIIGLIGKNMQSGGASLVTLLLIGSVLRLLAGVLAQSHPRTWMSRALHLHFSLR